jgi:hypothetical protein
MFRCVEAVYRANRAFGNVSLSRAVDEIGTDDLETERDWPKSFQPKGIR